LLPDPRLTIVGSINLDLVARTERLPRPGETVTDATFGRYPGGKGANQAVAAARLGADVRFVGCVGGDNFAAEALMGLREARVEVDVTESDLPTGVALITVDGAGETEIVVAPGANTQLCADRVRVEGAALCQLEIPGEVVAAVAAQSSFFCLNAAPARPVPVDVLHRADLVVVNRFEHDALQEAPRLVALTLGAEGAVLLENGMEIARASPPKVTVVDGTAAGDAFTACLLVSRLEDRSWEDSLRRACAAGAIAASRKGAQSSLPWRHEIEELVAP
jgi:ribokinase